LRRSMLGDWMALLADGAIGVLTSWLIVIVTIPEALTRAVIDRVTRLGFQDLWSDLPNMADWIERLTGRPAYAAAQPNDEFRMPAPKAGNAVETSVSGN